MSLISLYRKIVQRERVVLGLLLACCLFLFAPNTDTISEVTSREKGQKPMVFFIILCDAGGGEHGHGGKLASDINRQLRQTAVMLKSAAAMSTSVIRFLVVSDSLELFGRMAALVEDWPTEYRARVVLERRATWYPAHRQDMRDMFRVCATERLFLPEMFPDLDAAIYIDTDLIFMRPLEDLWNEFHHFNEKQVAAMAPCLYHYGTKKNKIPFYGKTGLNAGIMHMNLTRMKSFPGGGWLNANMNVFDKYQKKIKLADQDILNILFHKHDDLLYELGCEWNYRVWQCSQNTNMCPAADNGVNILHGNALAFVGGHEMKIQAVFEAWEQYELGAPLQQLVEQIRIKLQAVDEHRLPSKCAQIPNIDKILLSQMEKQVR